MFVLFCYVLFFIIYFRVGSMMIWLFYLYEAGGTDHKVLCRYKKHYIHTLHKDVAYQIPEEKMHLKDIQKYMANKEK